jgi:hypothetical protein
MERKSACMESRLQTNGLFFRWVCMFSKSMGGNREEAQRMMKIRRGASGGERPIAIAARLSDGRGTTEEASTALALDAEAEDDVVDGETADVGLGDGRGDALGGLRREMARLGDWGGGGGEVGRQVVSERVHCAGNRERARAGKQG